MTSPIKPKSIDINNLDIDRDGKSDHVTIQVSQTGEQSFSVRTLVDSSKDGFGTLSSDKTQTLNIDTKPNWQLSSLKFEQNKLLLLGQDGTTEALSLSQAGLPESAVDLQKKQLDKEIANHAGVLGSLRDDAALDSVLGSTGLSADNMTGIGGLIGNKGTQIGSGGLGARGSGLSGGGTAEGLGGLGTKGRGTGTSGYGTGGGNFGSLSEGGIGTVGKDPVVLGGIDKSLIDAVIKRNMSQVRYCYSEAKKIDPNLNGNTTVKFTIAKDGSVSKAEIFSSTMPEGPAKARLEELLVGRFMRFQFPEPKGGGIVITKYPFIFRTE